jgi:hypothetical protein
MQSGESSGCLREPQITLCFGFEPGLEFEMSVLWRVQELLDPREGAASRSGPGLNGLVGTVEIIPGQRLDVRAEHEVCVALPYFELVFLSGADGAADHLENVGWRTAVPILEAHRNADNVRGAKLAGGARRDLRDETAIGEAASPNLYGFEQARKGAAGANRFREISVRENYGFPGGQIRRDDGHWDSEILKTPGLENLFDEISQPVIAGKTQPGDSPSCDVTETQRTASSNDASEGRATGIGRAKDAANAGAGDIRNWNVILLEDLQNAEMGESTRESAA